jgi:hypothetical protein
MYVHYYPSAAVSCKINDMLIDTRSTLAVDVNKKSLQLLIKFTIIHTPA